MRNKTIAMILSMLALSSVVSAQNGKKADALLKKRADHRVKSELNPVLGQRV